MHSVYLYVDDRKEKQIMTDSELITQTENQISLIRELVKSHGKDLKTHSADKDAIHSRITIKHCYETLLRLNELLVKPIYTHN